jgi:uncharacterized membrane protein YheB (UPF0754 family)
MHYGLIIVPVIAAFAGWLTVRIAFKLLFHPANPVSFAGIIIHGLIPSIQLKMPAKLVGALSQELVLQVEKMERTVADAENLKKLMPYLEEHIDQFLRIRLVQKMPMIGMLVGERTILEMKSIFIEELETLFPSVMTKYMNSLLPADGLEEIVIRSIKNVSIIKLEKRFYSVMSGKLNRLSLLGAIWGLVIGLVQIFALMIL